MSQVSNRHNVNPFVAGKSQPLGEQRLAKIGYKTTEKTPAKFPSVCVSVPTISQVEMLDRFPDLVPYIRDMLADAQDGIIRSLYESSGGQLSSVSDEEIGIDSIIAFKESQGGRLTKEFVASWFDAEIRDNLTVALCEKLGFEELNPEQQVVIDQHLAGYRGLFGALAGGKTLLPVGQLNGLKRALEVSGAEGEIADRLMGKIAMQLEPKKSIELVL